MGLINKAFVGMDVVDGIGKTKQAYNSAKSNKYDDIMGTKPIKTTNIGGYANAMNGKNTAAKRSLLASEEIDNMYKQASIDDILRGTKKKSDSFKTKKNAAKSKVNSQKIKDGFGKASKAYNDFAEGTSKDIKIGVNNLKAGKNEFSKVVKHIANGTYSSKSAQAKKGMNNAKFFAKGGAKHLGKGVLKSAPALAGMAGASYGAYKLMDKFEQKKDPKERNDIYPKAVGATIGGAMLANAIVNKDPYATLNVVGKSLKKSTTKIPRNAIKATGPVGKFTVEVGEKVKKRTEKMMKGMDAKKGSKPFTKTGDGFNGKKNFRKKNASEILDFFFEKQARQVNLGLFAKDVVKKNIVNAGLDSIPYFAAPAMISCAVGRDFRKGGKKIKNDNQNLNTTIIDVPIEKSAASINLSPKAENFIRKGAEGIGRTVVPGVLSMAIGRNIMDGMKKIDNDNDVSNIISQDIPKGHARVIVQSNGETPNEIGKIFKNASSIDGVERVSDVLSKLNEVAQKERGNKASKNTARIAQGVKKQQRMNI